MSPDLAFAILDAIPPDANGCMNFVGVRGTAPLGYCYDITVNKAQVPASRLMLQRKLGRDIASGFQCRHTCNNSSCVTPEHLVETLNGSQAA
jgi:hypothetical protein